MARRDVSRDTQGKRGVMQGVGVIEFGGPEALQVVDLPEVHAAPGEVRIRVHAAAVIKARLKGDDWLADRIYSGVPAAMVGRRQQIEVGPMSGASNVEYRLRDRGIEPDPDLVAAVLAAAKAADHVLDDEEIDAVLAAR